MGSHEKKQGTPQELPRLGERPLTTTFRIDLAAASLFALSVATRFYRLDEPRHVVFDELHYCKYAGLYVRRTFFFDSQPPLGKQLVALCAYLAGFDGKFKFDRIGSPYTPDVPVAAMRLVPALFGSLIAPTAYSILLELGASQWAAGLGGLLLVLDNALLTQSRFVLMESMLVETGLIALLMLLRAQRSDGWQWGWTALAGIAIGACVSIKYSGVLSLLLVICLSAHDWWRRLATTTWTDRRAASELLMRLLLLVGIPVAIYVGSFWVHLATLTRAGPHDSLMTSTFQASLEGGLASIVRGQPSMVAHGSQVTLRHSHGRPCWLHSHPHPYPLRYADKRGSSHQQQVTCYSFKDVNNWWIVKRPNRTDLATPSPTAVDAIRHGDMIELVHGITGRSLNSHDVAAPMSPMHQEVSCYVDYNVSMPGQTLWRVEVVKQDGASNGDGTWHSIQSMVRLVHVNSSQALKFSGRQLPDWGFNQHEVVTDRVLDQEDTLWNVEEHRYTKSDDQKERERELVGAEMIPERPTSLTFWSKFWELQRKMLLPSTTGNPPDTLQNHLYGSDPAEWPFLVRGIAYWVSPQSNAQVHLLGNLAVWFPSSAAIITQVALHMFFVLRRRRGCLDASGDSWLRFQAATRVLLTAYLLHYVPFFLLDRTLFLHHYLPAYVFQVMLLAALVDNLHRMASGSLSRVIEIAIFIWVCAAAGVFVQFSPLSYGLVALNATQVAGLRWLETWDLIIHKA